MGTIRFGRQSLPNLAASLCALGLWLNGTHAPALPLVPTPPPGPSPTPPPGPPGSWQLIGDTVNVVFFPAPQPTFRPSTSGYLASVGLQLVGRQPQIGLVDRGQAGVRGARHLSEVARARQITGADQTTASGGAAAAAIEFEKLLRAAEEQPDLFGKGKPAWHLSTDGSNLFFDPFDPNGIVQPAKRIALNGGALQGASSGGSIAITTVEVKPQLCLRGHFIAALLGTAYKKLASK